MSLTVRRAATPVGVTVVAAGVAAAVVAATAGAGPATGFAAEYLVEFALTFDTALALYLVVNHLGLGHRARVRVVRWALAGAVGLRVVLLPVGALAPALDRADWIAYPAGATLLAAAILLAKTEPTTRRDPHALSRPFLLRLLDHRPGRTGAPNPPVVALLVAAALAAVLTLDGSIAAWALTDSTNLAVAATLLATAGIGDLYRVVDRHLARLLHVRATLTLLLLFAGARILTTGPDDPRLDATVAAFVLAIAVGAGLTLSAGHKQSAQEVHHAPR